MDITVKNQNRYANRFINGETVNYSIAYAVSFFILIAVKQFLNLYRIRNICFLHDCFYNCRSCFISF